MEARFNITDQFNDLSEPDPNVKYYFCSQRRSSGFTPLMKYILMIREYPGTIHLIENIIKCADEVNKQNHKGWTVLMIVCVNYNLVGNDLISRLINSGADINIKNNRGDTALMMSSIRNNTEIMKMLIESGADVDIKNNKGQTALILAVKYSAIYNSIEAVKMLVKAGADINFTNNGGQTALTLAARYSADIEIVKLLIVTGVDTRNNKGQTALMVLARHSDDTGIFKMLISAGADSNLKDNTDQTCLMILLMTRQFNNRGDIAVELLYSSRETLLDKDIYGKTAYDYYVDTGYNILDDYHLKMLKGEIRLNNTKSARFC